MATIINRSSSDLRIVGTNEGDDIETGSGDDTIFGRGGRDLVFASSGNDLLLGMDGNDRLNGVSDNDRLFGGLGDDVLIGASGNDRLAVEVGFADFGTDVLEGNNGFDTIAFETASIIEVNDNPSQLFITRATRGVLVNLINTFIPGRVEDFDLSRIDENGELIITLETARGRILDGTSIGSNGVVDVNEESSVFADVEEFELTVQEDYFLGSAASHLITGRGGNDFISGGGGADTIDGGSGRDTALYGFSSAAVSVSLLDFGNGGSGSGGQAEGDKLFSVENVFGSGFGDSVIGGTNNNTLRGRGGDDDLFGLGGVDTLAGEDGNDDLAGGLDADILSGGGQNDTLDGGSGNDQLDGGAGTDMALFRSWNSAKTSGFVQGRIVLGEGRIAGSAVLSETFFGRPPSTVQIERDTLRGVESVIGSDFRETIAGNSISNTLEGRGGLDTIDGRQGADTLRGGDGGDRLIGGVGGHVQLVPGFRLADNDILEGGGGTDIADYSGNIGTVVVSLGLNGADGSATEFGSQFGPTFDTLRSVENVVGSDNRDTITGNEGENVLSGGDSDDSLEGNGGADSLNGGEGSDTASYLGADVFASASLVGPTADFFAAAGDTYTSIENLAGSRFGDRLEGNGLGNILAGNGGDDTLVGRGGEDTLIGDSENDTMIGGAGADDLQGGEGLDTASYEGAAVGVTVDFLNTNTNTADAAGDTFQSIENLTGSANVDTLNGDDLENVIDGGDGSDTLAGRGGADTLSGEDGDDTITAGNGADEVFGGLNDDTLFGNIGDDTLTGGDGVDELFGGNNNDELFGNRGNDTLNGGAADDDLFGGFNSDTYRSGVGNDTIFDGAGAADVLQIASLDAIASSTRVGDDLVVRLAGGQTITVRNHFIAANRVESVTDGTETVVLAAGLTGGDASGIISGSDANEVLDGRGGDDILFGAGGRDWLLGGLGDDQLRGGAGGDTLTGDPGDDTFVLSLDPASDIVTDFAPGSDRIAFERASFGFAAEREIAELMFIGGSGPADGEALHVTENGYILYDDNWGSISGRQTIAQLIEVRADDLQLSDFMLV